MWVMAKSFPSTQTLPRYTYLPRAFGVTLQHILPTSVRRFVANQFEIVIVAIQLCPRADCRLGCLFLAFQELFEDAILNQLGSALGEHL